MLHIIEFLQSLHSTTRFTEEFDFEAMNEKFKKDVVWGHLGKVNQKDKAEEGIEDNVSDQSFVDKQDLGLLSNFDPKVFLIIIYTNFDSSIIFNMTLSQCLYGYCY